MRYRECVCLSRVVLTHTSRQAHASLIFDVGQNILIAKAASPKTKMTGNKASTIVIPTIKYGAALILMISGVFLSAKLISSHLVGEWSFCFLILSSILVGVLVCLSDRLKEVVFGFKEWRIVLSEIKERENNIKKISVLVGEVASFVGSHSIRSYNIEPHEIWITKKIEEIEKLAGESINTEFYTALKARVSDKK